MATYNGGRFLREQLDSVLAQTLPPAEMIVCDDRSTDDTGAIIAAFTATAPFPVRLVVNETRLGASDNFLKAISLCTSPLVALCDQDDVWLPEKLATSVARIAGDDSLLALHTARVVDEALRPTGWLRQGIARNAVAEPLSLLAFDDAGWGMSMTFRRAIAELDPAARRPVSPVTGTAIGHDTWMYVLAGALGRVSQIDAPLILYRQHGANAFGVAKTPLRTRMLGPITVPVARHRHRARFLVQSRDRLREIARTSPAFAAQAAAAATTFDRLAEQAEARVRLYAAPSIAERLAGLIACHRGRPAGYASLAKDTLLGVFRIGRITNA